MSQHPIAESNTPIIVVSKNACVQCNMTKRHLTKALGEPSDETWVILNIEEDPELYDYITQTYEVAAAPVILLPGRNLERYTEIAPNAAKRNEDTDTVYFTGFVPALLDKAVSEIA